MAQLLIILMLTGINFEIIVTPNFNYLLSFYLDLLGLYCSYNSLPSPVPTELICCAKFQVSGRLINVKGSMNLSNLVLLIKSGSIPPPPPSPLKNLVLKCFGKLLKSFSAKVNWPFHLYLMVLRCCLLHMLRQICFLNCLTHSLLAFPSRKFLSKLIILLFLSLKLAPS